MKKTKTFIFKLITALAFTCGLTAVMQTTTGSTTTQTVQAAHKLSKTERAAKRWIAMHESGGNYSAKNGSCYGKYQLNISYLHGNYSKKNQDRTADNYVYGRYGSWVNAKRFWLAHNWY